MNDSDPANAGNGRAAWTVMVYMAGDNSLTDACVYALTDMKKSLDSDRVRIFAQFDPKDDHLPTHRYLINSGGKDTPLAKDCIDTAPFKLRSRHHRPITIGRFEGPVAPDETPTGDGRTLFNFLSYCIEASPADHYMVILFGHGSGTQENFLLKDDSPIGYLTMSKLKWVFKELNYVYKDAAGEPLKIDIVGMDTCLMSMAEICYEIKDYAKVMIGCESYSPSSGWPFLPIVDSIQDCSTPQYFAALAAGQLGENELARRIVADYVNFYADYELGGLSVDQSALNLRAIDNLRSNIGRLSQAMVEALEGTASADSFRAAVVLAHWDAQSYNGEQFVDIVDFCHCLQRRYPDTNVAAVAAEVGDSIQQEFVIKSC